MNAVYILTAKVQGDYALLRKNSNAYRTHKQAADAMRRHLDKIAREYRELSKAECGVFLARDRMSGSVVTTSSRVLASVEILKLPIV